MIAVLKFLETSQPLKIWFCNAKFEIISCLKTLFIKSFTNILSSCILLNPANKFSLKLFFSSSSFKHCIVNDFVTFFGNVSFIKFNFCQRHDIIKSSVSIISGTQKHLKIISFCLNKKLKI